MPFTQEKGKSIGVCTGCDERCELGVCQEKLSDNGLVFRTYPTISGTKIESYVDCFGTHQSTMMIFDAKDVPNGISKIATWTNLVRKTQMQKAYAIAKLCDNYKTR